MISFLNGDIVEIKQASILIDVGGVGFEVLTSRPYDFTYGRSLVYTYFQVKEDSFILYGFKTRQEKDLFMRLIEVSGIGPKTACAILGATTVDSLIAAIEFGNIAFLKKLPTIGAKAAQQIVLDLKGKLVPDDKTCELKNESLYQDVYDAMRQFGYKIAEIDAVFSKIENPKEKSTSDLIRECLKMLKK